MIKKIINFRHKASDVKRKLKMHSEYLNSGVYILDNNLKFAYRNDPETIKFINNILLKNNYKLKRMPSYKDFVKNIVSPEKVKIVNQNKDSELTGTVYLMANNNDIDKDVKLFNVDRQEVLSIYVKREKLEKKIKSQKYFSKYFNIPRIKSYDLNKRISVEDFIISKPKSEWNKEDYEKVISEIFHGYINYYSSHVIEDEQIHLDLSIQLEHINSDPILCELGKMLEKRLTKELINYNFPFFQQHGDLWFYNILLSGKDKKKIFLIDWEYAGQYVFFYDVLLFMKSEALNNNDYSYLESYFSGKYDSYMEKVFRAVNLKFNPKIRKSYYFLFLINMLHRRMIDKNEIEKNNAVEIYAPLIQKIDYL